MKLTSLSIYRYFVLLYLGFHMFSILLFNIIRAEGMYHPPALYRYHFISYFPLITRSDSCFLYHSCREYVAHLQLHIFAIPCSISLSSHVFNTSLLIFSCGKCSLADKCSVVRRARVKRNDGMLAMLMSESLLQHCDRLFYGVIVLELFMLPCLLLCLSWERSRVERR